MHVNDTPKPCLQCGAVEVSGRTKFCETCRKCRIRERARVTSEKKRRAEGVLKVKGTDAKCGICKCSFVRGSIVTKYCEPCRLEANRKRARDRVNRLSRERGAIPLGITANCAICKCDIVRNSPKHIYCKECAEKRQIEVKVEIRARFFELNGRGPSSASFRKKTKEEQSKAHKEAREKRKSKNPEAFALNERMSANIRQSLKKISQSKKKKSWESVVGYTVEDLRAHLESQFLPGMGWHNIGEWHIDHISPLSAACFKSADDPAFRKVWALSNLRPLWGRLNLIKGPRTDDHARRVFEAHGINPALAYPLTA